MSRAGEAHWLPAQLEGEAHWLPAQLEGEAHWLPAQLEKEQAEVNKRFARTNEVLAGKVTWLTEVKGRQGGLLHRPWPPGSFLKTHRNL